MSVRLRVRCPRCHNDWWAYQGQDEVQCNCHEYCEDGDKPQDCTLVDASSGTYDVWNQTWSWPQGMHLSDELNGKDVTARIKYCTTHDKYVNKVPLTIDVLWDKLKVPYNLKWHRGNLNVSR